MVRRRALAAGLLLALVGALGGALVGGQAAMATDEPTVPEPVALYFASGLVPRLADLYGPGKQAGSGIDFDSTTKVGDIHRVFSWTADYLARKKTNAPTELTNNWIAPVSVKDQVVGLATVWINPTSDDPELSNFDLGPGLVSALAAAPKGTVLIRDDTHSAWFATDGTTLTPLVSGTSGVASPITIAAYQKTFPAVAPSAPVPVAGTNQGLVLAGIVLVIVVLVLAAFVLLPDRLRRPKKMDAAKADATEPVAADPAVVEPAVVEPAVVEATVEPTAVPAEKPQRKPPVPKTTVVKPAAPKTTVVKTTVVKTTVPKTTVPKPAAPKSTTPRTPK